MSKYCSAFILCNLFVATIYLFTGCSTIRSVGKYPSKKKEAEYAQLPNYKDGTFRNIYDIPDTPFYVNESRMPIEKKIRKFSKRPKLSQHIPSVKTNLKDTVFIQPTIIWFGHSSYLIQSNGYTILVDPVLSDYASPLWYFNRSIPGSNVYKHKDMPAIDLILITHDHYDHLDCHTVRKFRKKQTQAIVPLGVGTLLDYWGWKDEKVQEVNWGDTVTIDKNIRIVSTPAQHRSGRWTKKDKTLWTSYVLEIHGYRLFLGGDSGYNKHFKDIGDKYGPFDLAILENGQYNVEWPKNHSFPEQNAHTAQDLQARMILPVHWGRFASAYHRWNEPITELLQLMDEAGIPVTVPKIGEPYTLGTPAQREVWWDFE